MTRSAGAELKRALRRPFARFAGRVETHDLVSRPWSSVTFSGERHRLTLRIDGAGAAAAADVFLDGLSDREFELHGHIMADIAVVEDVREGNCVRLTLEALTVAAN